MNVLVIDTISHASHKHGGVELSRRDYLHRAAFELGRTLTAYEIQMVQSLIDHHRDRDVVVCGFGEGARIALLTGAIDKRVNRTNSAASSISL